MREMITLMTMNDGDGDLDNGGNDEVGDDDDNELGDDDDIL